MGELGASETPTLVGRRLGDFVVREPIGEGGFAQVYLAYQPLLDRQAVIKVLHRRHGTSEVVIQRFLREAKLASRLDHPYAAHIYSFGAEPDGLLWIAMELVRGVTLSQLIAEQGPLSVERLVPLLSRICEVVHTAHEQGIVHRDLKSDNVMVLSRAGRLLPKLLDLGIAKDLDTVGAVGDSAPELPQRIRGILGSPHYMAPEQWHAPSSVDRRTDVYALGIVAYEALTGSPPFTGNTTTAIARGHAKKQVPPLGPAFPSALNDVFACALAKWQDKRYDTVIELAEAFAAASGARLEQTRIAELDAQVAAAWLASAPQPLAEAMAMLDAARDPVQAHEAMRGLVALAAQYVALVALASWPRATDSESPPALATQRLRELQRRGLATAEWVQLARALVEPFADKADVHPIPELVLFFYPDEGARSEIAFERLLELIARADEASAAGTQGEASAAGTQGEASAAGTQGANRGDGATLWQQIVRELGRTLRGLSFLFEYALAVPGDGLAERWMGVRRTRRPAFEVSGAAEVGHPLLVDAAGAPVVTLHPVVQISTAVPGAQPEMFLLDGPGRRGARLVARPRGFEHQSGEVWGWLRAYFLTDVSDAVAHDAASRAPYRGLSSFTTDDADLFFGREREAEMFTNRVRVQPFLAVVGPSGAGKSSFIQAGVVPSLPERWRVVTARPGASPTAALLTRLAAHGIDVDPRGSKDAEYTPTPSAIANAVHRAARDQDQILLLIIDQFEELFTLCRDASERAAFVDALMELTPSAEAPVRLVITLRDDFLMKAQSLVRLRERFTHSLQLLATPAREDLLRILIEPAERVGYRFEDDRLPEEMVDEVAGHPSALALLSFAAARLWELRDREFEQLRRAAYESMGGVGGALAHHADAVLDAMSDDERGQVREAFRHLVTAQGTRAILTRQEMEQLLGDAAGPAVIETLIGARLLVAQEGHDGGEQIEITHEALIADWPTLVKWRREDAEGARLRDELRGAARQWDERDRPDWLLWRGEALTEYRLWRARFPGAVTDVEGAFARASLRVEARGRRLRQAALTGAFIALTIGLVVTLWLSNRAAHQRDRAEAASAEAAQRLMDLLVAQARQEFVRQEPLRGLAYLKKAISLGSDSPTVRYLLATGLRVLSAQQLSLQSGAKRVTQAMFFDGDRRIITSALEGHAHVWDVKTGERLHSYAGDASVMALSPDEERVVIGGFYGAVRVWSTRSPTLIHELAATVKIRTRNFGTRITCVGMSRDGTRIVAGKEDFSVRIWNAQTGALEMALEEHDGPVHSCEFSRDGAHILTASDAVRIWDTTTGELRRQLDTGHQFRLTAMYSPDSSRVLTYSLSSQVAQQWDAETGALRHELRTQTLGLRSAAYSDDGRTIVTGGCNGSAQIWDAETGEQRLSVRGHDADIQAIDISPDGERMVTASNDRLAIVWDMQSGERLTTLTGHTAKVGDVSFDTAGHRVLTTGDDGTARVWSAAPDALLTQVRPRDSSDHIVATVFSPDGERFLTYSRDRVVQMWDVATGRLLATYDAERKPVPASNLILLSQHRVVPGFDPSGATVAVPFGNEVRVLDAATMTPLRTLRGHTDKVTLARFSPDGQTLVTTSFDRTARLWSVESGAVRHVLEGSHLDVTCAVFSRDGELVATAGYEPIARIWDVDSGALVQRLEGHKTGIGGISFGPDGRRIATASSDTSILVWDVASGKREVAMEALAPAFGVAFSPDGDLLISIDASGRASVWDAHRGHILARLGFAAEFGYWVEFSADGARAAVSNGVGQIWGIERVRGPIDHVLDRNLPFVLVGDRVLPQQALDSAPSDK